MTMTMSATRERLIRRFADFAYRHAYLDSFVDATIATQIKVLRESRGWTQDQLAETAKMKQSQVSRLEDTENSSWQVRTLKRIAKAMDVALVVRFESFSSILPEIEQFSRQTLERPSFNDDVVASGQFAYQRDMFTEQVAGGVSVRIPSGLDSANFTTEWPEETNQRLNQLANAA